MFVINHWRQQSEIYWTDAVWMCGVGWISHQPLIKLSGFVYNQPEVLWTHPALSSLHRIAKKWMIFFSNFVRILNQNIPPVFFLALFREYFSILIPWRPRLIFFLVLTLLPCSCRMINLEIRESQPNLRNPSSSRLAFKSTAELTRRSLLRDAMAALCVRLHVRAGQYCAWAKFAHCADAS